jgi:protein TonB
MSSIPTFRAESFSVPQPGPRGRSALTATVSMAVHVVGLAAVLVLPLLSQDQLPEQAGEVRAFFATPLEIAPPPPPPPAAAPRVAPRVESPRPAASEAFTAPIEVPAEVVPESSLDLGLEGGVSGGVEGGVPGGVVGGVVGGLPDAPQPRVEPLRVGGVVKEPRKLKDVPPVYPDLAVKSRLEGVVIIECVVDPRGRVQEARVLRGPPLLDAAALEAVRQWVYSTTLIDGVPVPVILTVTVNFRMR